MPDEDEEQQLSQKSVRLNGKLIPLITLAVLIGGIIWQAAILASHTVRGDIHQTPDQKRDLIREVIRSEIGSGMIPPAWFRDDVRDIKARLNAIDDRLRNLEAATKSRRSTP